MSDIFISYSSEDKSLVKYLVDLLQQKGWSVWWDHQIPIGKHFDEVIEKELEEAKCVIVIWTKRSVASEWVKSEASEAASKSKLVPILLENVNLPINFKRIEAAQLIGWQGDPDQPELQILYQSIGNVLNHMNAHTEAGALIKKTTGYHFAWSRNKFVTYSLLACFGIISLAFIWYWISKDNISDNISFRIVDWKNNPITQGEVKIYLNEYVREESIDSKGLALMSGIPQSILKQKVKVEASSPGYTTQRMDTIVQSGKPFDITLPFTTKITISGRVKTAGELPIKGVEINVDGTRYYAVSITDGTYVLHLNEYTLGDEIRLTTSHGQYEDKTIHLKITGPEIINEDIFLNPVHH